MFTLPVEVCEYPPAIFTLLMRFAVAVMPAPTLKVPNTIVNAGFAVEFIVKVFVALPPVLAPTVTVPFDCVNVPVSTNALVLLIPLLVQTWKVPLVMVVFPVTTRVSIAPVTALVVLPTLIVPVVRPIVPPIVNFEIGVPPEAELTFICPELVKEKLPVMLAVELVVPPLAVIPFNWPVVIETFPPTVRRDVAVPLEPLLREIVPAPV